MTQQFIHSLSDFVGAQLLQYGQVGILEIVLEPKMYDRVFHEVSSWDKNNPLTYCDYLTWKFSHGDIQIRKFGTKDKDFHHTGIEKRIEGDHKTPDQNRESAEDPPTFVHFNDIG